MAAFNGGQPWYFKTDRGIFSTPIIDASGNIYFGSADHFFYALNPDGHLEWKYETGEIINSAGALFDAIPGSQEAPLVFISGDGNMYGFKLDNGITNPADRLIWKYEAQLRPGISLTAGLKEMWGSARMELFTLAIPISIITPSAQPAS